MSAGAGHADPFAGGTQGATQTPDIALFSLAGIHATFIKSADGAVSPGYSESSTFQDASVPSGYEYSFLFSNIDAVVSKSLVVPQSAASAVFYYRIVPIGGGGGQTVGSSVTVFAFDAVTNTFPPVTFTAEMEGKFVIEDPKLGTALASGSAVDTTASAYELYAPATDGVTQIAEYEAAALSLWLGLFSGAEKIVIDGFFHGPDGFKPTSPDLTYAVAVGSSDLLMAVYVAAQKPAKGTGTGTTWPPIKLPSNCPELIGNKQAAANAVRGATTPAELDAAQKLYTTASLAAAPCPGAALITDGPIGHPVGGTGGPGIE